MGPTLALNASDMMLGCGRSRCGQLVVVIRAFSGFDNERNQRVRREAHAGAKSPRCGTWEIVTIGLADDCVVGVNRIGASSTAWVAILAGPPCLGARAIALVAH